jgi:hypothetical protein
MEEQKAQPDNQKWRERQAKKEERRREEHERYQKLEDKVHNLTANLSSAKREGGERIKEQYKIVAEWLEHLGLAVTASVVFQKVVSGASLSDPLVVVGSICALVVYAAAVIMLLQI